VEAKFQNMILVDVINVGSECQRELAAILQQSQRSPIINVDGRMIVLVDLSLQRTNDREFKQSGCESFYNRERAIDHPTVTAALPEYLSSEGDRQTIKKNLAHECRRACERRNLEKGHTITNEIKYEIAKEIGLHDVGEFADFKHGQPAYHMVSKLMSINGYSSKPKKNR
jgi:hypothetical protein